MVNGADLKRNAESYLLALGRLGSIPSAVEAPFSLVHLFSFSRGFARREAGAGAGASSGVSNAGSFVFHRVFYAQKVVFFVFSRRRPPFVPSATPAQLSPPASISSRPATEASVELPHVWVVRKRGIGQGQHRHRHDYNDIVAADAAKNRLAK